MKRHSFFSRLFLGNLLLVAIIAAVSWGVAYTYLNADFRRKHEAQQERLTRAFQRYFQHVWPLPADQVDRQVKDLARGLAVRLTVIAHDGRVLGDSESAPHDMVNHKTDDRPEVLAALGGSPGRDVRSSETLGIRFRYLTEPIRHDGRVVGVVRTAMPVKAIVESESFISHALLWAGLAAVGAAVALGLLLSWIWYAPLRQITLAARTIASGDLTHRPRIGGSRELAQLGTALNDMRQSLAAQIDLVASQRQNLADIIANLREGVVAVDKDNHIVLMNDSARRMLSAGQDDVIGRHVQAVVRVPEVVDALNELSAERPVQKQIEVDARPQRRTLDVHAARMAKAGAEGICSLLVVRDITELARTAAVKAEFVANASHELRTPLATIRAAVDSLSATDPGDPEALKKITAILDRHVKRLEDMAGDLLDLHFVEQSRGRLHLQDIQLGSLVEWVRTQFAPQAERKGVRLEIRGGEAPCRFRCDRRLLELILQNLLDNGIKFTPAQGSVVCTIQPWEGGIMLSVADTGCGIPPEMRGRVFERFFQADPARTKNAESRGTGLGLAIVKYACERLGAKLDLDSEVGQGTTVKVHLPVPARR